MKKPALEISYLEYRKLTKNKDGKPRKKNKYSAQSTLVDGLHFPSKLEAAVWCQLKMLQKAGEVLNIFRYPSIKLPGGVVWKCDFRYSENNGNDEWLEVYAEAKGVETADYKVKLKLFEEFGDRPLHIWKGNHKKPFIWKTITPKGLKE